MKKRIQYLLSATFLILAASLPITYAQKRVSVYADEAESAVEESVTYEASCPSGRYRLRIDQNRNRAEFEFSGSTQTIANISDTSFGTNFLKKSLQGRFYSTCPSNGIRIYFYGIEPQKGQSLKTVKYRLTISQNGTITQDGGLQEESAGVVNYVFARKAPHDDDAPN